MNVTIFRCESCGSIIVINNRDLWKVKRCTKCMSSNLVLFDKEIENNEFKSKENSK